ncbi:hypothetical protein SAMN05428974_0253 [Sphingopyxis sp. YR583]|jgi:hypothetical protein|uniref:hypothetical protein n=1 Tax=Sphingopyxis sp. YR583 TaxID=1881047 RepID=UPI0008A7F205|nr:hypothetical protein [Sphingopyxis sp. YR583]SEH11550.1 hypothetical protein SAMN05428974_0253 [Sphingopyxis sp. YR583]
MPASIMRLLMIIGVLLCSMHLAEPASAHSSTDDAAFHLSIGETDKDSPEPASKLAHGGHHHCPVAPDLGRAEAASVCAFARAPLFAAGAMQLPSRDLPPLLDPPLSI